MIRNARRNNHHRLRNPNRHDDPRLVVGDNRVVVMVCDIFRDDIMTIKCRLCGKKMRIFEWDYDICSSCGKGLRPKRRRLSLLLKEYNRPTIREILAEI